MINLLIFAKNDNGKVLVRGGSLLSKKYIPLREVNFTSTKISFDDIIYFSDIEIAGNNIGVSPGKYRVAFVKNLKGLEECQYVKVNFTKFPVLNILNIRHGALFGV